MPGKNWTEWLKNVCSFPCPGCRINLSPDGPNCFCPECLERLHLMKPPYCPGCGGEMDGILEQCSKCLRFGKRPWEKAYALFELEDFGQEMIHRYKYQNAVELARAFAKLAAERLREEASHFDAIVPVPLHWTRYLTRGYNQATLFSELVGMALNIPFKPCLERIRLTKRQATLNREQRMHNLRDAFRLRRGYDIAGKHLLLVDDVMTTGSTLTEACRPLSEAKISILVIGRR